MWSLPTLPPSTSVCIHPAAVNLVKLCVCACVKAHICVRASDVLYKWKKMVRCHTTTATVAFLTLKHPESPLKGSICVTAQFKHRLLCENGTLTIALWWLTHAGFYYKHAKSGSCFMAKKSQSCLNCTGLQWTDEHPAFSVKALTLLLLYLSSSLQAHFPFVFLLNRNLSFLSKAAVRGFSEKRETFIFCDSTW